MAMSYETALTTGFPDVIFKCNGDPFVYENLDWEGGDAIPSQEELDTWILENPGFDKRLELTKYEFRQLFTLSEKVAIDNFQSNSSLSENTKHILVSIMKDLELSAVVHLDNPNTISGIQFLVQSGLLTSGRAIQILSNEAPT
jgi:hypothetical protein